MKESNILLPVLKWVGGKRQILKDIVPYIEQTGFDTYIEPFFGGGAVLFALTPPKAIVNDCNEELINTYCVIRNDVDSLIATLKLHAMFNSNDYYYRIREWDRSPLYSEIPAVERAARFLYLNKTCYNGLYRVNRHGEFNVPVGKYKHPNIINEKMLRHVSNYFKNYAIDFYHRDFSDILDKANVGDFVYLDPPYMPISASSAFTSYTDGGFTHEDQVRLKRSCDKLRDRGIPFIESNSDCAAIRALYKDYDILTVQAKRSINSNGARRGKINEVLIMSGIKN